MRESVMHSKIESKGSEFNASKLSHKRLIMLNLAHHETSFYYLLQEPEMTGTDLI